MVTLPSGDDSKDLAHKAWQALKANQQAGPGPAPAPVSYQEEAAELGAMIGERMEAIQAYRDLLIKEQTFHSLAKKLQLDLSRLSLDSSLFRQVTRELDQAQAELMRIRERLMDARYIILRSNWMLKLLEAEEPDLRT